MRKKPTIPSRPPAPSNQAPQLRQVTHHEWQGPLPPPAALAEFNNIVPNGAERIFAMVEQEQSHRLKHDSDTLTAATHDHRRGAWMGFVISLVSVVGAISTAYAGAHPTVSVALVSLPVMAAVRSFLKRK